MEIKQCPCGKIPDKLIISPEDGSITPKWASVSGDCCGDWEISFRNQYHPISGNRSQQIALEAWNAAERGW